MIRNLGSCPPPLLYRQVCKVPAQCPPRVVCINRRLPTPAPDICERITVIKPPRDVIHICIEKPYKPAPCFMQREICGKPRKPIIQPKVICVAPRSNPCVASQPAQQQNCRVVCQTVCDNHSIQNSFIY